MRGQSQVDAFVGAILAKINTPKNLAKPHWRDVNLLDLHTGLQREREEVDAALLAFYCGETTAEDVAHELADEAAYLMFLHDNIVGG